MRNLLKDILSLNHSKMKLHKAQAIADRIVAQLVPSCNRVLIAGSVRREQPEVKDIEIVVLPKYRDPDESLWDLPGQTEQFFAAVKGLGDIKKGSPDGRYVQVHSHQGIMIDLFIPQPFDFWRIFAIRTGSRAYSQNVIARGWNQKGWVGTADGLRLELECERRGKAWKCVTINPHLPPTWASEEQFFEWLGVPFISPSERDTGLESPPGARPYLDITEKIEMGYFTPTPEDE